MCRRDPVTLTKSKKDHPSTNKDASNGIVQRKPTASRHVLLIRHGQYNEDGETDEQRALTPLGVFSLSDTLAYLRAVPRKIIS